MVVELPWPPSVNTYWRHPTKGPLAGRHLISEEGRAYRQEVWHSTAGHRDGLNCRIKMHIDAFPPDRRKRDLDNILKSLIDALVYSKVIADDSLIDELSISRREVSAIGAVIVTIQELETT